jgi:transposase
LIARLTAQLRCYVPEPIDETWGRLRHLDARREELVIDAGCQIQQKPERRRSAAALGAAKRAL